jgi:hypothetical protein
MDFLNLFRVAAGVRGHHQQRFVTGDGSGNQWMIGYQAARIVAAPFDPGDHLGAGYVECGKGPAESREAPYRTYHFGGLDMMRTVGSNRRNLGLARPVFLRMLGSGRLAKAGKQIALRLHHVLHTLENRPPTTVGRAAS